MDKKEKTRAGRNAAKTVSIADFHKMLVLSKWALGIFDGASFEPISQGCGCGASRCGIMPVIGTSEENE